VSAVNIVGGFIVAQRMLDLFKRPGDEDYSHFMAVPAVVLAIGALLPGLEKPLNACTSLFCIMAIGGLATMKTSQFGCKAGMAGVAGGVFSTLVHMQLDLLPFAIIVLAVGSYAGKLVGETVSPIQLPQTVAAFHSLVGFAAMSTSVASFIANPNPGPSTENISSLFGDFIGGITLTGSIVAYLKLDGKMGSKALDLPFKNYLNLLGLALFFFFAYSFLFGGPLGGGQIELWLTAVLAMLMGYHLVASVGGGDMPVCITVLNSYSGWALVAEGFLLKSVMLTIVGSLIGFSGAILTKIMCDAMNRDIFNVIFGGMNTVTVAKKGDEEVKPHTETNCDVVAELLAGSKSVLIVPGYGMAVSRAQGAVGEIAQTLQSNGISCKFGIHPVAGRMPGQMNVLLAEAGVPYDWVFEMDEVNPDMESFDVCLVVGANDITNSAAKTVEGCPIYGMPVLEVWRTKKVIFFKRSMGGGYADLENPVFFLENTDMLLGDAKKSCDAIGGKLKQGIEDLKV